MNEKAIVRYSWYEVDYESEMLKQVAGMMPEHVFDDPGCET